MRSSFPSLLRRLRSLSTSFDAASASQLQGTIGELRDTPLPLTHRLLEYYNALLFVCAYPASKTIARQARQELHRIGRHIRRHRNANHRIPSNEGLPWLPTETSFSPAFVRWLSEHPDLHVRLSAYSQDALSLNDVLNLSMTSLLRSETTAGFSNDGLLDRLHVKPGQRHAFLAQQVERLRDIPLLEDLLFEKAGVSVQLAPKNERFSRAGNRRTDVPVFVHGELLKDFDHEAVINSKLPSETNLDNEARADLISIIKNAMALSVRETDPATFLEPSSLKLFELERGLSVCIFGMNGERQLPLESYIGYTMLKNGFPCSYGGAWIFGTRAGFGINIFEAFRGGESGYIVCQLLRVYKQLFHLSVVEVEPYQFGLNNPEGITSAAFWFYYRYGFRPLDRSLRKLAEAEQEKIHKRKGYRSSETTLKRFTQSSVVLTFARTPAPRVADITNAVIRMIARRFDNDHSRAEEECQREFIRQAGMKAPRDQHRRRTLREVSLWSQAMEVRNAKQLRCLCAMVNCKSVDEYRYQELVREFFSLAS